jgi:hypothetical protein
MGLKIHRMMKDERKDPEELANEAQQRREVSDSILDVIYGRIIDRHRKDDKRKKSPDDRS